MITVDSSVLVPALQEWHPAHAAAFRTMRSAPLRLVGHVCLETYSRLTGAAPRTSPAVVTRLLQQWDPEPLALPSDAYLTMLGRCATHGVVGGAVHDTRIAATAREHGAKLYSRDRRAARAYEAIGVDFELLADQV